MNFQKLIVIYLPDHRFTNKLKKFESYKRQTTSSVGYQKSNIEIKSINYSVNFLFSKYENVDNSLTFTCDTFRESLKVYHISFSNN